MKYLITAAMLASLAAGAVMAQDAPAQAPAPADQARQSPPLRMFDQIDANSDGVVTQAEIDAWKAARFAEVDTNGDGRIDAAELVAKAEADRARRDLDRAERMLSRMDADGDGVLTADEMSFAGGRDGDMFARLDADGDGSITRAEAEAAFARMHDRRGPDRDRGHGGKQDRDGRHEGRGGHDGHDHPRGPRPAPQPDADSDGGN